MKKLLVSLFVLTFSVQVFADNLEDSNSLFAWAETKYPEYFNPSGSETFQVQAYLARRYSKRTYLGTQGIDVFVYSPLLFKGKITKVGVISDFIDVYNQEAYDKAQLLLSQDKEYQSLKEGLVQEAIEEELGDDFVSEVEDKLLKLLTSGKEHQVSIIRKNLDPLVAAEFLSIAEQQAISNIYSDLLNGDISQSQVTAVAFVASATTELGKLMASDIQEYVDKSTCDQEGSNSENVGGAIGAVGGAAWGGVAGAAGGAIFTGGPGVLAGALGGAGVGASVGNAVGKAIGGLLGGLFGGNDGPDDGGECGGDNNDGGDADG